MSKKVKITADAVLAIVKGIFADEDVNITLDDPSAPPDWAGKTIEEILNVEYHTLKHRPISTQAIINKMLEENKQTDQLAGLKRAFCMLSLGNIERLFSKDVDMAVLSASMEYYIQTNKIKLLEYLIEDCNIATSGLRIPVTFGDQTRQAVVIFGRPVVGDVQTAGSYGEMALVDIAVNILLYPDSASYSDYEVCFSFTNEAGGIVENCAVPLSSFSYVNTMTQKAVPKVSQSGGVGSINLSRAVSFVLVFDGYNNDFVNHIVSKALLGEQVGEGEQKNTDNNQSYEMTIKRKGETYTHIVVVKDHQVIVPADTSNETHTLTLVTRGL